MDMRIVFRGCTRWLSVFCLLISLSGSVPAQETVAATISDAFFTRATAGYWQVSVSFDFSFDSKADIATVTPSTYKLLEVESNQPIKIIDVQFSQKNQLTTSALLLLDPAFEVDRKKTYLLFSKGVTFEGKAAKNLLHFEVPAAPHNPSGPVDPDQIAKLSLSEELTAAKSREDANIYAAGEINRASGTDFTGSVDLKIEKPLWATVGATGKQRTIRYIPFFELKASNMADGDPDSATYGFRIKVPVWRYRAPADVKDLATHPYPPFLRLYWDTVPKLEAERDFDNANFAWDNRLTFMSKTWKGKSATMYMRPFFGYELGANLKSPLTAAEHKLISRPYIGSTLNLIFAVNRSQLKELTFENSYIRRWPLRREIALDEDKDGNLIGLEIGTAPRDYVNSKFRFDVRDGFGIYIGYEYGSLPPSFKLVDHKLSIGFVFKLKYKQD